MHSYFLEQPFSKATMCELLPCVMSELPTLFFQVCEGLGGQKLPKHLPAPVLATAPEHKLAGSCSASASTNHGHSGDD